MRLALGVIILGMALWLTLTQRRYGEALESARQALLDQLHVRTAALTAENQTMTTRVEAWLAREGPRPNLALDYHGDPGRPVGRVLRRGESRSAPTSDALVVLEWAVPGVFFVLTSYPEVPR